MAASNSTAQNDAFYVSNNLADVAMFVMSAMRLAEQVDGEIYCLLDKAHREIIAAQDYLEAMDPVESPISKDVAAMLGRIGCSH